MIWESFFSALGSTVGSGLISLVRNRDETRLRKIIREELENYAAINPSVSTSIVNNTNITMLVNQIQFLNIADELKLLQQVPIALLLSGYVNLIQKATGQYLDGNGSTVYPHPPNGGVYQDWKVIGVSPNVIKLQHRQSGKLLDAAPDKEEAYLLPDNRGLHQQWEVVRVGDEGFFKLKQLATKLMLDAGTNNHAYILENNPGDYQLWKFVNWRS